METILAWLAGLPAAAVTEDPRLALVKATTLQEIGRTDEADHWLEAAERGHVHRSSGRAPTPSPPGSPPAGRSTSTSTGTRAGSGGRRRPRWAAAVSGSGYWHSALLTTLGTAQFVTGQVEEAALTLEQAIDAGVASGHTLALAHALGWAVVAHVESGRPDRARRLVQQIDDYLVAHAGLNTYYGAAMPHIARGVVLHHDGMLAEADHELARGSELARRGAARFEVVYGLVARARLTTALGDQDAATAHAAGRPARADPLPGPRQAGRSPDQGGARDAARPRRERPAGRRGAQRSRARRAATAADRPLPARDRRTPLRRPSTRSRPTCAASSASSTSRPDPKPSDGPASSG